MRQLRRKAIDDDEVKRLLFELRLAASPRNNKRALQDVCVHYEAGRTLVDANDIRQSIHGHLHSQEVLLRRWSFKALGLIGSPLDTHRVIERLKIEGDHEAVTWGTAALFKNAQDRSLSEIAKAGGLDTDKALVLAARLYADGDWVRKHARPVTVSLTDDPLVLKWAVFLIGYDKAPPALFDPRHDNDVFLGELNAHDIAELSEYSVWALWERQEFDSRYVRIPLDKIVSQPENVRKWLYRLYAKSHELAGLTGQVVSDLRSKDHTTARDGLARGITDTNDTKFDRCILDWHADETDEQVKTTLLKGIVSRSNENAYMKEIALYEFSRANGDKRQAMLASASGQSLYGEFRAVLARELGEKQPSFFNQILGGNPTIIQGGDNQMTGGNTFNVGGSINAQNVVGGDMVNSAHKAVQNLSLVRAGDRDVLEKVLEFLRSVDPNQGEVKEVYSAVEKVSADSSTENKRSLLDALKGLGSAITIGGGLAEIVALVKSWI